MKNNSLSLLIAVIAFGVGVSALIADEAAEMAPIMKDPLATIKAVQNENNISFNAGGKA